jgi:hypothetical protein
MHEAVKWFLVTDRPIIETHQRRMDCFPTSAYNQRRSLWYTGEPRYQNGEGLNGANPPTEGL